MSEVSCHYRIVVKAFASGQCGPSSIPGRSRSWSDPNNPPKFPHCLITADKRSKPYRIRDIVSRRFGFDRILLVLTIYFGSRSIWGSAILIIAMFHQIYRFRKGENYLSLNTPKAVGEETRGQRGARICRLLLLGHRYNRHQCCGSKGVIFGSHFTFAILIRIQILPSFDGIFQLKII